AGFRLDRGSTASPTGLGEEREREGVRYRSRELPSLLAFIGRGRKKGYRTDAETPCLTLLQSERDLGLAAHVHGRRATHLRESGRHVTDQPTAGLGRGRTQLNRRRRRRRHQPR